MSSDVDKYYPQGLNARFKFNNLSYGGFFIWHLVFICFGKYIFCDVCGLRSPSFESSSVLYISSTDTSSMQNLILQRLQQKWQKSCSRCNKNTWHVESSYILQPPKYLLLFVNRFRYINNNVTKDRCSIPMYTTVRLGPLKFSLRATIDHHGPSIHSGHYTASINCCKKTFYCNDHTITEFGIIDSKNSSTAYIILYELIETLFWNRTGGWEFDRTHGAGTSSPSHWQQVEEQALKPVGWVISFLLMTFVPVQKLCVIYIYIYVYICIFYMSSLIGRIYTYNRSVIQYWWSCTPSHSIGLHFWGVRGSWVECHFLFSLVYQLCIALWW